MLFCHLIVLLTRDWNLLYQFNYGSTALQVVQPPWWS